MTLLVHPKNPQSTPRGDGPEEDAEPPFIGPCAAPQRGDPENTYQPTTGKHARIEQFTIDGEMNIEIYRTAASPSVVIH